MPDSRRRAASLALPACIAPYSPHQSLVSRETSARPVAPIDPMMSKPRRRHCRSINGSVRRWMLSRKSPCAAGVRPRAAGAQRHPKHSALRLAAITRWLTTLRSERSPNNRWPSRHIGWQAVRRHHVWRSAPVKGRAASGRHRGTEHLLSNVAREGLLSDAALVPRPTTVFHVKQSTGPTPRPTVRRDGSPAQRC